MKTILGILTIWLFSNTSFGQNLVPNPSFEEVNEITNRWSGTFSAFNRRIKHWDSPTQGSPDILFIKNLDKMFPKRPKINLAEHEPRTGKFMTAIKTHGCAGNNLHCKEYLQIKLKKPLQIGEQYVFEYWVNPTQHSIKNNNFGLAMMTTRQKDLSVTGLFPLDPVFTEKKVINAPPNDWQRISGTFKADSAYQYLIIGNFMADWESEFKIEENGLDYGFYLLDDVSLKALYAKDKEEVLEVGQTVVLEAIYFEFDKAELLPKSFPVIDKMFETLQEHPTMEIEIRGHTDHLGTADYNLKLSTQRAKAVADFLIKKGIADTRIRYNGYGGNYPIIKNDTEEHREINRRVEFRVEQE